MGVAGRFHKLPMGTGTEVWLAMGIQARELLKPERGQNGSLASNFISLMLYLILGHNQLSLLAHGLIDSPHLISIAP